MNTVNAMGLLVNAAVVGVVTLLFNALFYYLITRRETLRDSRIHDLEDGLRTMKTERIQKLEDTVRDNHNNLERKLEGEADDNRERRREIYDEMKANLVTRREFAQLMELRTDQCKEHAKHMSGFQAEMSEFNKTLSGADKLLTLIASHLNIKMGDPHAGKPN